MFQAGPRLAGTKLKTSRLHINTAKLLKKKKLPPRVSSRPTSHQERGGIKNRMDFHPTYGCLYEKRNGKKKNRTGGFHSAFTGSLYEKRQGIKNEMGQFLSCFY